MIKMIRNSGFAAFLLLFVMGAFIAAPVFVGQETAYADVAVDDDIDVDDDDGLVEEVFEAIGYVIALPFRIVAGVVEAIF